MLSIPVCESQNKERIQIVTSFPLSEGLKFFGNLHPSYSAQLQKKMLVYGKCKNHVSVQRKKKNLKMLFRFFFFLALDHC